MNPKELFCVVVRLAGLYLLVSALLALGLAMLSSGGPGSLRGQGFTGNVFMLSVLGPGGLGFYFLRFAPAIAAFAWGNEASKDA